MAERRPHTITYIEKENHMNNDNEEWIRNVIAQAVATHADEEADRG